MTIRKRVGALIEAQVTDLLTSPEVMLARAAGRIVRFLDRHRGLGPTALRWWAEHADVDVRHAEEGLTDLARYAEYSALAGADAVAIAEVTLRENILVRRYFRVSPGGSGPETVPCGS